MTFKEALNSLKTDGLAIEINEDTKETIKASLLEMYKDVLAVCQNHGLIPYLAGGSALGAIRHKGFIPWDDDLDISMTRADYEEFKRIFEKELSDKYILNAPNYSKNAVTRFPKVLKKDSKYVGIGITNDEELQHLALDIFVIENVPENKLYRRIKGTYCNILEYIAGRVSYYQNRSRASMALLKATGMKSYLSNVFIGGLFSYRNYARWNDKADRAVQYKKESTLCSLATGRKHYFGEMHEKEKLLPEIYVPFEDIQAPVFSGYDRYLRQLYGDYMEIPPESKREKHFVEYVEL